MSSAAAPTADAYVQKSLPNSNFGGADPLQLLGSPSKAERFAYLKFNLSLPTGVNVNEVKLRLYFSKVQTSQLFVNAVPAVDPEGHDITWSETGLTWTNRPLPGAELARVSVPRTTGYTEIPLPKTGATNGDNSFTVQTSNSSADVRFRSRENPTNKPQLVVTTEPGPPVQQPPSVTTGSATGISDTAATLTGTVNPNGAATTYQFEYGTTTSYGNQAPVPAGDAGSGTTANNVSASLSNLQPSTTYHYRMNAMNATSTTHGTDATFTTNASPQQGQAPT